MSQKRALEHLAACVKRGSNFRWHGQNGLRALRPGADPELVERAMKIILPWSAAHCLDRLPDEYAPIAWRILATITTAEATFLRSYDPAESPAGLRAGCVWLVGAHQLAGTAARSRVASLCRNQAGVAAARATVVAHGVALPRLLAVIAHDGKTASLDAVVEVVDRAERVQDETLDRMHEWFVPYVRGAAMTRFAKELVHARDVRGEASTLHQLVARFGVTGKPRLTFELSIQSRQVQQGLLRKVNAHVGLATHSLPSIDLMISRNGTDKITWWEDGKRRCDDNRLGKPSSLDDLPRWLATSARTLRVTWDRDTLYVRSSLRGKARQAAIDWLFPGPLA